MITKKYLFFDLDHTLWDTNKNSEDSLRELYIELNLKGYGIPSFEEFFQIYTKHNERLWGLYAENQIAKDVLRTNRFYLTFIDFQIDNNDLAHEIANEFIERTPRKPNLIEGAKELLEVLYKDYNLSIITNGFKESQHTKLMYSGIDHFFEKSNVFISEELGFHKPDPSIFNHAMKTVGAHDKKDCFMIGDTFATDIVGAVNAGWNAIHYSPEGKVHHEPIITVQKLMEITDCLKQY
jgi:putative hydrolase of the HAD superfamily